MKFRIWTQPGEMVNNFYIYFNQFKVLTDMFESFYDGEELGNPTIINQIWGGGADNSNGNEAGQGGTSNTNNAGNANAGNAQNSQTN